MRILKIVREKYHEDVVDGTAGRSGKTDIRQILNMKAIVTQFTMWWEM